MQTSRSKDLLLVVSRLIPAAVFFQQYGKESMLLDALILNTTKVTLNIGTLQIDLEQRNLGLHTFIRAH